METNYETVLMKPDPIPNTIQVGHLVPKIKSRLKIGNMIIYNDHRFNWFHRMMWKLFFGFEIENLKEG